MESCLLHVTFVYKLTGPITDDQSHLDFTRLTKKTKKYEVSPFHIAQVDTTIKFISQGRWQQQKCKYNT